MTSSRVAAVMSKRVILQSYGAYSVRAAHQTSRNSISPPSAAPMGFCDPAGAIIGCRSISWNTRSLAPTACASRSPTSGFRF